jgi:hypothetical protein
MPDEREWLERVRDELRREEPVRPGWRAELLERVRSEAMPGPEQVPRRFTLSPLAAVAAALAFMLLGATGTWLVTDQRSDAGDLTSAAGEPGPRLVRFQLDAPRARDVALVGDFNGWDPARLPMVRLAPDGPWTVSVSLPPGRHVYAFLVDGGVRPDPSAPRAVDDDFGKPSSVVFVPVSQ